MRPRSLRGLRAEHSGHAHGGDDDRRDPGDDARAEVPAAQSGDADRMLELLQRLCPEHQYCTAHALLELTASGAALQVRVEERVLELRDLVVETQRDPSSGTVTVLWHRPECHTR